MASIFEMFKPTQPTAPAAPTANPAPPASVAANPTVPSVVSAPATQPTDNPNAASPLAKFDDLWKNDPNAKPTDIPFTYNADPAKLLETARTVDFTKIIPPEVQKRIAAGGDDGIKATMEAINAAAQMSFAQSSHAAAKITEQALQAQELRFRDSLPSLIKQHTVSESLRSENPLLTSPAAAPMVEALQAQFSRKYPNASGTEIKQHVNDYLNSVADTITGSRAKPAEPNAKHEQDWDNFFSS